MPVTRGADETDVGPVDVSVNDTGLDAGVVSAAVLGVASTAGEQENNMLTPLYRKAVCY